VIAVAAAFKLDPADRATINYVCREKDSPSDRSTVRARHVGGLRKLFELRHGDHLPDTADGRRHLFALLQNLAGLQFSNARTLVREIERLAPWMSEEEMLDTIERIGRRRTTHRGATLGKIVGLVDAEREACGCWSIWPIDLSLAEAKLRAKANNRECKTKSRRAAGARPQSESLARTKPWVAAGMGRTKWFELRKQTRETAKEAGVAAAKKVADDFVTPIILSSIESISSCDETVRPHFLPAPSGERRAPKRDGAPHGTYAVEVTPEHFITNDPGADDDHTGVVLRAPVLARAAPGASQRPQ
jgi:hypothetical protein